MKKYISLFVCFIFVLGLYAKPSVVFGLAKDYAGKQLVLKSYSDEILFSEIVLDTAIVDSLGNFSFQIDVPLTTSCFISLPTYQVFLFVEPNKTYEVELPPFVAISRAQQFNPYFKPERILLNIKNVDETDLNNLIFDFENVYNYYYLKSALYPQADSLVARISTIEKQFQHYQNSYFEEYRAYKYALMLHLETKKAPFWAIEKYISHLPASYHNMAFWEMLNTVFEDFFDAFPFRKEQQLMEKALKDADFIGMKQVLQEHFFITDLALQELIIIKSLYDAFFSEKHDAFYMYMLMNNWLPQLTIAQNQAILKRIIEKSTQNAPHTKAYHFSLQDERGKYKKLSDYKGKYVYLNFCNTQISLSKKDFGILSKYGVLYKKDLVVVNVFTDDEKESVLSFLRSIKRKNVNLFVADDNQILQEYQIKNIPSYFLIDREGFFILSPAPSPYENFEQKFEDILRKEKMKQKPQEPKDKWWE